jgi:hypothetical protein
VDIVEPPPPIRSRIAHVPDRIAADCSMDVSHALLAWIASVPDNSTLVFGKDACYIIDLGLDIRDRNGLTFEGNGATFKFVTQGSGQRSNWHVRGGSNLTWRNMTVLGANPQAGAAPGAYVAALEWQHGWRLRGTQGALLEQVQVFDVYGDFVNISFDDRVAYPGPPTRNVVVRNSHFERNGRYGLTITHGEDILFQNNYIGDVRWSGVNVELNTSRDVGRNITVEGNRFGPLYHHMLAASGAGYSWSVGNFVIRNNVMEVQSRFCLRPITIGSPSFTNPDGSTIYWSGFTIEGNLLRPLRGAPSIGLTKLANITIGENTIEVAVRGGCDDPNRYVVDLKNIQGGIVKDNIVTGPGNTLYHAFERIDDLSRNVIFSDNRFQ